MDEYIVLSYHQAQTLLHARDGGREMVKVSLDLGLSIGHVRLHPEGVLFPDGQRLDWEVISSINDHRVNCFVVRENTAHRIEAFSERFNRFCSLMPTTGAPTILIGGFPMHRIKETDPHQDTLKKIRAVGPLRGRVLDTTTGLGYTAIEAARTARHVTTIEIDPTTLEIARFNPWSRALFSSPNIEQIIGDAFDVVQSFDDAAFSRIIHDPPMFQLAGELYSEIFYRHLFRVLKRNGHLFHYIGSPKSTSGHGITRGVVRRLHEAGFARIVKKPEAFGIVAYKE